MNSQFSCPLRHDALHMLLCIFKNWSSLHKVKSCFCKAKKLSHFSKMLSSLTYWISQFHFLKVSILATYTSKPTRLSVALLISSICDMPLGHTLEMISYHRVSIKGTPTHWSKFVFCEKNQDQNDIPDVLQTTKSFWYLTFLALKFEIAMFQTTVYNIWQ